MPASHALAGPERAEPRADLLPGEGDGAARPRVMVNAEAFAGFRWRRSRMGKVYLPRRPNKTNEALRIAGRHTLLVRIAVERARPGGGPGVP
jgi:hypothetical protein